MKDKFNPAKFGQRLCELRKQRGWERQELANELDKIAATGPEAVYREVDASLIGKWERAYQKRRPTRFYVIYLVKLFRPQLDLNDALEWAKQAGFHLNQADLADVFPAILFRPPHLPQKHGSLNTLELLVSHRLFGIEEAKTKLRQALEDKNDHWILSIDGIGGIGKTSLASLLTQDILEINRFYDVAWISAKQEEFVPHQGIRSTNRPALEVATFVDRLLEQLDPTFPLACPTQEKLIILANWLKSYPYLVVIDNLETVSDYQELLPTLLKLANSTKFLLTSRHSLRNHSQVYSITLEELTETDTICFIRHEAEERGLSSIADASEVHLRSVYETVGGNPLALKLVVGQMSILSLPEVLENLKQIGDRTVEDLYTFIYWQAWQLLDMASRKVFLMMPLAHDGTTDHLKRLTTLEASKLNQALQQLAKLSLIQIKGDLLDRRYLLHRLTETFLLNEAVQWKTSA